MVKIKNFEKEDKIEDFRRQDLIVKGKYQINDGIAINWYRELVDGLKKLAFEGIVRTKHAIGKRILIDELKFNKPRYGSKRIENLAKDLDTSKDDLWACMRFAKKYKNLDAVQQFSWRYIWHKLLPAPKPEKLGIPLPTRPKIYYCDYKDFLYKIENNSQDLLITDPPYSTDIENIEEFANDWVIKALDKVKPTGRAFICIGAYPRELKAYLDILLSQDKFILDNPLIWTYRNTLGQTPKMKYNLNYQIILHLYSKQSRKLDTKITNEMFSVQDINAPDGRQGNRYHTWQKPSELARRLITHTTQEGDEIFDCFGGTGTFVLVGAQLGRKVMGCDNSREMLKIAEERGCEII